MFFSGNLKKKSDKDLAKLIILNNEKAFEELMKRYENQIYFFISGFINDKSEAEDILQETFLKFYKALNSINPDKNIKAFIFTTAKNLSIDFIRKKKPLYYDLVPENPDTLKPFNDFCKSQEQKDLYNAIQKLPEVEKSAIILKYKAGMKYIEIAEILGKSESAVESILVRARKKLRSILKEN